MIKLLAPILSVLSTPKGKKTVGVVVLLVIGAIVFFTWRAKRALKKAEEARLGKVPLVLPEGVDIPNGWSPILSAARLRSAMPEPVWYNPNTYMDDEEEIFATLDPLNDAQLVLLYNEYQNQYDVSLIDEFSRFLSNDTLNRALNYFQGLINLDQSYQP